MRTEEQSWGGSCTAIPLLVQQYNCRTNAMRTDNRIIAPLLCAVLFVVAMAGCGRDNGPPRVAVSGTVTYQGKSVAQGQIRFIPTKGSTGPVSIAEIVDGKYRMNAGGGVPVATQKVEILAYRPDPKYSGPKQQSRPMAATLEWPPKEQYLPAKYNVKSELEIAVEAGHGEIRKNFELVK